MLKELNIFARISNYIGFKLNDYNYNNIMKEAYINV